MWPLRARCMFTIHAGGVAAGSIPDSESLYPLCQHEHPGGNTGKLLRRESVLPIPVDNINSHALIHFLCMCLQFHIPYWPTRVLHWGSFHVERVGTQE